MSGAPFGIVVTPAAEYLRGRYNLEVFGTVRILYVTQFVMQISAHKYQTGREQDPLAHLQTRMLGGKQPCSDALARLCPWYTVKS